MLRGHGYLAPSELEFDVPFSRIPVILVDWDRPVEHATLLVANDGLMGRIVVQIVPFARIIV